MAYRFEHDDETVERGLRRIACEQIDRALGALENAGECETAIHDVRKCCKRLRGLVRLVRTRFDDYEAEDHFFRDTARLLGGLREREVLLETFDTLVDALGKEGEGAPYARLQRELGPPTGESSSSPHRDRFEEVRDRLTEAHQRADRWTLEKAGWIAVCGGLARTYRSARRAQKRARLEPTGEHHHEWRKHAEYHWFHTRLLRRLWSDRMEHRVPRAKKLSTVLGDHHDLYVFEERISERLAELGLVEECTPLVALARDRRDAIERKAHRLGARLLAERPRKWNASCATGLA
jgi:CHAD domain-containing protein